MRKFQLCFIIPVCLSAMAAALPAAAQKAVDATPPKLEKLEEGEAPAITIRKPGSERKVTEKRSQGKVKEVKVQTGGSTYYLKPNEPAGSALPGDAESNSVRAPQWQVLEFGQPKPTQEAKPPQTLAPAEPSAPASGPATK